MPWTGNSEAATRRLAATLIAAGLLIAAVLVAVLTQHPTQITTLSPIPHPAPFQDVNAPPPPPPPAPGTGGEHRTYTFRHPGHFQWPPWTKRWKDIAYCESTWRWHVDTGNGFYGGLQFTLSTWNWYGGGTFDYWPNHATPFEQRIIAERVLHGWNGIPAQGIGAWPVCGASG